MKRLRHYRPLTSRPFNQNAAYTEIAPCEDLAGIIHCFWGSPNLIYRIRADSVLVTPDTCTDIIVKIDHQVQTVQSYFVGMQDQTFVVNQKSEEMCQSQFAIRFHFWAAHLFLEYPMVEFTNKRIAGEFILKKGLLEIFNLFPYRQTMIERIHLVEEWLVKQLSDNEINPHILNATRLMTDSAGDLSVAAIVQETAISQRQLERLFKEKIGFSIKRTMNLVRYQKVWQEMIFKGQRFDVLDCVSRFGYTDQSHLLKEFKKFHSVSRKQALIIAEKGFADVEFLQDSLLVFQ